MHRFNRLNGFDRALEAYLEANRSRDLPLLEHATASNDEVCVTMPTGAQVCGRNAALAAKKQWFAQPQWRMDARVIWTIELDETALAVIEVVYSDADQRGLPRDRRFRQVLAFRRHAGEWKAVAEVA